MRISALTTITALLVSLTTSVDGATMTVNGQYPVSAIPPGQALPWSPDTTPDIVVNAFDTLGGTRILTGVDVKLTGTIDGTHSYSNNTSGNDATLTTNVTVSLSGNGVSLSVPLSQVDMDSGPNAPAAMSFDVLKSGTDMTSFTGAALVPYIDLPSVTFTAATMDLSNGVGSSPIQTSFNSTAGAEVMVTYTYEQRPTNGPVIPEPSTFGMMAIASLLGLGFSTGASRRRRKR